MDGHASSVKTEAATQDALHRSVPAPPSFFRLFLLNSRGPVTRAPFAKAAPDRLWKTSFTAFVKVA